MALSFPGGTSDIRITSNPNTFDYPTLATIEFWIYLRTYVGSTNRYIVARWGGWPSAQFWIAQKSATTMGLNINTLPGNTGATWSYSLNTWTHIAFTYVNTGIVKVYKNGILVTTGTGSPTSWQTTTAPFTIGNWSYPVIHEPIDGIIDELRFWNYERTIDQIASTMYKRVAPEYAAIGGISGLYLYNRLDEGALGQASGGKDIVDLSYSSQPPDHGVAVGVPVYADGAPIQWGL